MSKRRSRCGRGLHSDQRSLCWIAAARHDVSRSGRYGVERAGSNSKTEPMHRVTRSMCFYHEGLALALSDHTAAEAVECWPQFELTARNAARIVTYRMLGATHGIAALGARRLRNPTAQDAERWLTARAQSVSTRMRGRWIVSKRRLDNWLYAWSSK
jgi:hypothetical protein